MAVAPATALIASAASRSAARSAGRRVAGAAAVGRGAGHHLVAEPAARTAPVDDQRRRGAAAARAGRRTWAFFETFVGPAGPPPAAGQCAGASGRAHRPPHFADQHRPVAAGHAHRARLRLPDHQRADRAHRRDARRDGAHGALPRPLVQLVRHADAAAAAPGVCLVGGQRQPRGPPADAACRPKRLADAQPHADRCSVAWTTHCGCCSRPCAAAATAMPAGALRGAARRALRRPAAHAGELRAAVAGADAACRRRCSRPCRRRPPWGQCRSTDARRNPRRSAGRRR